MNSVKANDHVISAYRGSKVHVARKVLHAHTGQTIVNYYCSSATYHPVAVAGAVTCARCRKVLCLDDQPSADD